MSKGEVSAETLKVYSAWVPSIPLREAAEAWGRQTGTPVRVVAGCPESWMPQLLESHDGDVISCGAQFLLDRAEADGLITVEDRRSVGVRRAAIIVHKGNPLGIGSLEDLARDGVRVGIAVGGCSLGLWDDLASRLGLVDAIRRNIVDRPGGCCALIQSITKERADAILGWSNFPAVFPDELEAVELPEDLAGRRSTGVGLVAFSPRKQRARELIDYLADGKGREVYRRWGWILD